MAERIIRVLRLLEYIGPETWVRETLAHSTVQGTRYIAEGRCITATIISEHEHGAMPVASDGQFPDQFAQHPAVQEQQYPEKIWIIGLPQEDGLLGLHGPFPKLNDALMIVPEYPNCVIVEANGDPRSKDSGRITHLWIRDHWAEQINGHETLDSPTEPNAKGGH